MAVVSVQPIHERRRSSYRDFKTVHYLLWLVTCDQPTDGPATAIVANGVPQYGTAFVNVDGSVAYLTGIDVDVRGNSDRHFEVMVEFTYDPTAPDDNPLNQPWGFSWSYQETTEPYFIDQSTNGPPVNGVNTGAPVVNSAGEAFEQFMQREKGLLTITMTRNEASHDAAADDAYSNTVNLNDVTLDGATLLAGKVKLSPIAAVKSYKKLRSGTTLTYYAKTYVFKARHEGWLDAPLDVGFNELTGNKTLNTQSLRPIVDSNGMPIKKPWPLDGTGKKKPNATDSPNALSFQPYTKMDWTALNFQ
jgi:hypothetical protein